MRAQFKKYLTRYLTRKNLSFFVFGAIVAAAIIISFAGRPKEEAPLPVAQAPAGECPPLPSAGKQTYNILTGNSGSFMIVEASVDPIDVGEGGVQTITVKVKDDGNNTITGQSGVTANILTDNKNTAAAAFNLRLAEDSEDGSSLLTTWEGSWTRDDSYCHTYMESISATNDKGDESKVDLAFR